MEILAIIPVYTYPWIYNFLFVIAVVVIICGIAIVPSYPKYSAFIGLLFIGVGILLIIHTNKEIERTKTLDYNEYKVIIDETISARDFLDKYEVISKEGEIFTIREIESD